MTKSRLELRAPPMIVLAYLVTPLVVILLWWSATDGKRLFAGDVDYGARWAWDMLRSELTLGWPPLFMAELAVVTPLLAAFHRYRWPWLNGWTAAPFGFAVGVGLAVGFHLLALLAGVQGPQAAGLVGLLNPALNMGLIGAIGALIFRLIAARPAASAA